MDFDEYLATAPQWERPVLRPMAKLVALWFPLTRTLDSPRITRKPVRSGQRIWHTVGLAAPADVDGQVQEWLTEAWADFG